MEVAFEGEYEKTAEGFSWMRRLMFMLVLTITSVVAIDHFTTKKSPLADEDWIPKEKLVRYEVGSSCPLYYPQD